ncbi:MAG TPA: DUF455 family protein [Polyangiaceae bacterium]|nr:DUF455 family protein [Polyangiaceae bacterium]
MTEEAAPPPATLEQWALDYLLTPELSHKCSPPPQPDVWGELGPARDLRPSRPAGLEVTYDKPRSVKLGAIRAPKARAQLIHKFWHHELQAAELMCWAVLRFPESPEAFRRGLLRIARDEIRHMGLYAEHLGLLGYQVGDFPVRDWFWERVPSCPSPIEFVAFLGMGLEGANLEHTERFAGWFRTVGDERGAEIQDRVGREEVAHVRFATRWFREWTGDVDFSAWCAHLPPPITPVLLRGKKLRWDLRRKAEMPDPFLHELEDWMPPPLPERPAS